MESMEVIIPACGDSAGKPRYLSYDYSNQLVLKRVAKPYLDEGYNVTVAILEDHEKYWDASAHIRLAIPQIHIKIMGPTTGPAETVNKVIAQSGDYPFIVRDATGWFNHRMPLVNKMLNNYVCVDSAKHYDTVRGLKNKSFVQANSQGIITNIVEKEIVSDLYCVGGYFFRSMHAFRETYKRLSYSMNKIYVSHVVQHMIQQGEFFQVEHVWGNVNVKDDEDWREHNDKPVIFCDIDGTLVEAQSRTTGYQNPTALISNVQAIRDMITKGSQVIFTTARPTEFHDVTLRTLVQLGFENPTLISGLHNARRILINDYNFNNPYPRAEAINIHRDVDNLRDYLK